MIAAGIAGASDIVSQLVVETREAIDRSRLLVCIGLGGLLDGFLMQKWFHALHSCRATLIPRILLHQLAFAPFVLVPAWFCGTSLLESNSNPFLQQLAQEWWPSMNAHWLLLGPAQAANVVLVSKEYQVLFANSIGFVWSTYLSWVCHRKREYCDKMS